MESNNTSPYEDNDYEDQSHRSVQCAEDDSENSLHQKKRNQDKKREGGDKKHDEKRMQHGSCSSDPNEDRLSPEDEQRSDPPIYSDDSEPEASPYSQFQTPSPTPQKQTHQKKNYGVPNKKKGHMCQGVSHPYHPPCRLGAQQHQKGGNSKAQQYKPPKDLDLATKKLLSLRLLKINEWKNAFTELQQQYDNVVTENRTLRQLLTRLQHHTEKESQLVQMMSQRTNDMQMSREQHRRYKEQIRESERKLKCSEEQVYKEQVQVKKCWETIARLKNLLAQQDLEARDELTHKLEKEKMRAQNAEEKIKEMERNNQLSNNTYKRQLIAEKRKTNNAMEEIQSLRELVEELTNKLKKKERELDVLNIYAKRMAKPSMKKSDSNTKEKVLSNNSTKVVETKGGPSSPDFPTPPPAVTDDIDSSELITDEYLSPKELNRWGIRTKTEDENQECKQKKMGDNEKDKKSVKEIEQEKEEKQQTDPVLEVLENLKALRASWDKEKERQDRKTTGGLASAPLNQEEENNRALGHGHEDIQKWIQNILANPEVAGRHKKDQLLAKMHEIDCQTQIAQDAKFGGCSPPLAFRDTNDRSPLPLTQNYTSSIFNLVEPKDPDSLHATAVSGEGVRRSDTEGGATQVGTRASRSKIPSEDLMLGSYKPSFLNTTSCLSSDLPAASPPRYDDSLTTGVLNLRQVKTGSDKEKEKGMEKDKKSSFMQQLFGPVEGPAVDNGLIFSHGSPTVEVHSRRESAVNFIAKISSPPTSSLNTTQVAESKPAVCAFTSFDGDIEEITL